MDRDAEKCAPIARSCAPASAKVKAWKAVVSFIIREGMFHVA
jgi:hypothetical protein